MNTCDDDGPAFPVPADRVFRGMSLRDYFAAKALQGMLAHTECDYSPMTASAQLQVAADAYGVADAMLKARNA